MRFVNFLTVISLCACANSSVAQNQEQAGSLSADDLARARSVPASADVLMEIPGGPTPLLGRFTIVVAGNGNESLRWHANTPNSRWTVSAAFDLRLIRDQLQRSRGEGLTLHYHAQNDQELLAQQGGQVQVTNNSAPTSEHSDYFQIRDLTFSADASGMISVDVGGPDGARLRTGTDAVPVQPGTDRTMKIVGRLSVDCAAPTPEPPPGVAPLYVGDPTFASNARCRELLDGWQ